MRLRSDLYRRTRACHLLFSPAWTRRSSRPPETESQFHPILTIRARQSWNGLIFDTFAATSNLEFAKGNMLKHPSNRPCTCFSAAFTLVELLVVIAIMAVLAALLIPTAQNMIAGGNSSKCASNQRQIVLGMLRWIDENNGFLPVYNTSTGGSEGWL